MNWNDYIVTSILYHIDRLGVPLFFMLSGALILPKAANQNIISFYKKRIPQFIFLLFFYSILTKVAEMLCTGHDFKESILTSIKSFNAIYPNNTGAAHLWFMYAIIGLYLIAPFLGRLLSTLTNKEIILFLMISILFTQFKSTLQGGFNVHGNFLYSMNGDFLGAYLNFFILGYLIIYRKIELNLTSSITILLLPITIAFLREMHKAQFLGDFHWYSTSLSILTSSIGLLFIIKFLFKDKQKNKLIESISKYSFGIYLSHYFFIFILKRIIDLGHFSFPIKLILLFIPTFICSYLFTWILSKHKISRFLVM